MNLTFPVDFILNVSHNSNEEIKIFGFLCMDLYDDELKNITFRKCNAIVCFWERDGGTIFRSFGN